MSFSLILEGLFSKLFKATWEAFALEKKIPIDTLFIMIYEIRASLWKAFSEYHIILPDELKGAY